MIGNAKHASEGASEIGPEVVATWCERRDGLHEAIARQPDAEWAWLWRTRLSVLDYLIQRYAADQDTSMRPHKSAEPIDEKRVPRRACEETTSPYDRAPQPAAREGVRKQNEAIEARLASLRRTNAERHIEARRQRDLAIEKRLEKVRQASAMFCARNELLAKELQPRKSEQQAELIASRKAVAQALRELDERDYKALRRKIAFDVGMTEFTEEPLDEETIRLILQEHGIEDEDAG
ncbi:MAG: hypothetical protein AB8C95_01865 [Phycisphaeraceae bacterium]